MNGNKRPTQCDRLVAFMMEHEKSGVTQIEALNDLGILRLASRISELRDEGYQIKKEMITVKNRFGENCSIARYRLVVE